MPVSCARLFPARRAAVSVAYLRRVHRRTALAQTQLTGRLRTVSAQALPEHPQTAPAPTAPPPNHPPQTPASAPPPEPPQPPPAFHPTGRTPTPAPPPARRQRPRRPQRRAMPLAMPLAMSCRCPVGVSSICASSAGRTARPAPSAFILENDGGNLAGLWPGAFSAAAVAGAPLPAWLAGPMCFACTLRRMIGRAAAFAVITAAPHGRANRRTSPAARRAAWLAKPMPRPARAPPPAWPDKPPRSARTTKGRRPPIFRKRLSNW